MEMTLAKKEIHSILEDMESSMDVNNSKLSPGMTPVQERAYRVGYYAAIRDARRLVEQSPVIL